MSSIRSNGFPLWSRITVDYFSVAEDEEEQGSKTRWRKYLAGISSAEQASSMNLYEKVLAVQSGGRVLSPSKNLAGQLSECVKGADTYYTLTFDPPLAARADEYHSLSVELNRPGLTAHTSTG